MKRKACLIVIRNISLEKSSIFHIDITVRVWEGRMKRIVMLFIVTVLFSSCYLGPFHDVTWQVASTGIPPLTVAGVGHSFGNNLELYTVCTLPWSFTYHIRNTNAHLYADTATATAGSVTVTILVDGVVANTATAMASGTPASVQISASVPK